MTNMKPVELADLPESNGGGTRKVADESRHLKSLVRTRSWVFALAGLILVLVAIICSTSAKAKTPDPPFYVSVPATTFELSLGTAIFVLGLVNLFMETEGTAAYFTRRLDDVIEGRRDWFREILDTAVQRDIERPEWLDRMRNGDAAKFEALRANSTRVAIGMDFATEGDDGRFLEVLRDEIEPLLGRPHFEGVLLTYDCVVKSDGPLCYIEVRRTFEATVHALNSCEVDLGFVTRVRRIPGLEDSKLYALEQMTVDGVGGALPELNAEHEDDRLCFRVPLISPISGGQALEIRRVERLCVPVSDVFTWSVRGDRSVRSLTVVCRFNQTVYPRISAHGFGDVRSVEEAHDSCTLRFRGWMLPYQGFVISWSDPCVRCERGAAGSPPLKGNVLDDDTVR